MRYLPFLLILLGFLILFLRSRGLFRASAAYLLSSAPSLSTYSSQETLRRALIILFAADLLGAAMTWQAASSDTAALGYVMRSDYGGTEEETALTVDLDGQKQDVELQLHARKLSAAEIRGYLEKTASLLPDLLLNGTPASHVDRDLDLPSAADGLPVKITWDTSAPEIMDWDGLIGEHVPEEGAAVTLTAEITCEDDTREESFNLTVFPKVVTQEEALTRDIVNAVREANDETEQTVSLPDTIRGRHAVWSLRQGETGAAMLLLGILASLLYVYSRIRVRELDEKKRDEQMLIDYPNIVNKLVLLVAAGMSLRKAFVRIRADYREGLQHGGEVRPGYEEIVRMSLEMEHGVSEITAYENLGKRSRVPAYRTFSTLLMQNLLKGGSEMAAILRREAEEACEERKKRARILGEEAGTKLLLPMLMMLAIVMVILMVPAFFAFF